MAADKDKEKEKETLEYYKQKYSKTTFIRNNLLTETTAANIIAVEAVSKQYTVQN